MTDHTTMTAGSHLRGHPITFVNNEWIYKDTREPTLTTWKGRPCGQCGKFDTVEGHDACLGTLPGVMNACCGHGAYVQFTDGRVVRGAEAVAAIKKLIDIV